MAFWGVELKPGKPITHSCEKARGRLRISQATLGISDANKKSIVQCNVGKRSPVLLCVLLPNHTESCHLDLEFEEANDVVFSVIGPRSVYLTGYYVRQSQQSSPHSDTESYGVDIEDTQTEESSYHSDDDKYEGSFIDDDELQEFSLSPVPSNKENDKPKNKKGRGRRLQRKSQVVESDKDASSHESEDEDGYLLSVFKSKKAAKPTLTGVEANNINQDLRASDDEGAYILSLLKSANNVIQDLPTSNGKDQMHSLDIANPKKKRKECLKEEKTSEVQIDKDHGAVREDKEHENEVSNNMEIGGQDLVPLPEPSSGNCNKSKKRRKEQLEGTSTEGTTLQCYNVAKDDKFEQDLLHADIKKNLPAANGDQEQQIDDKPSIKSELPANASQPEKKTKKQMEKKMKNQGEGDLNVGLPNMTGNLETTVVKLGDQTTNVKPMQRRTLSNGLIIEEIATGPPDGKVASHGKKAKVFYTATLKENGRVFDSNVGKSSCKFRIGDQKVIEGWNLGIEGMRVGDKRRLIIPPSLGFGKYGQGENVPPNSWIVYDVELVGVRR